MDEYNVVVGLANPGNVRPLMRLACILCREHGGTVTAVSVVETNRAEAEVAAESHDRMSRGYELLDAAEALTAECEVRYEGRIAVGRGVAEVLDEVAEAQQARLIVVGFSERAHPDGDGTRFDRLIDEIAEHATCSLLVARLRGPARFDHVLVPVRERLNLDIRREFVTALHNQLGAQVHVVHFACSEDEAAAKRDELLAWLEEREVAEWVTLRVEVRPDPGEAIVACAGEYDAVVLGTAPLHEVRRKYFGAVPEYVADHARCSTFLLRTHDVVPLH